MHTATSLPRALSHVLVALTCLAPTTHVTGAQQPAAVRDNPTAYSREAPIGTVIAWAGDRSRLPSNWRVCEGQNLFKRDYRELTNRIGTLWGSTSIDSVRLPDLRGYFLRGVSGDSKRDPDVGSRSQAPGAGNGSTNDAGSTQGSAFASHTHTYNAYGSIYGANGNGPGPGNFQAARADLRPAETSQPTGGQETRPINASVYWIIRVK